MLVSASYSGYKDGSSRKVFSLIGRGGRTTAAVILVACACDGVCTGKRTNTNSSREENGTSGHTRTLDEEAETWSC